MAFNAVGVVDAQAGGQAGLTRITVHPNLEIGYSLFTWTYHGLSFSKAVQWILSNLSEQIRNILPNPAIGLFKKIHHNNVQEGVSEKKCNDLKLKAHCSLKSLQIFSNQ